MPTILALFASGLLYARITGYGPRKVHREEIAPLACPHCWRIGHVPIGVWAAAGRDYRAEKA